ncbi:hypothetical protein AALA36_15935 [Lachnospiraceae bacterium 66-29]
MDIYRDIGRVILKLGDDYYDKGMKKITVSIKGIRNSKLPSMNRKAVIPKLIHSKERDKFIEQFLGNLKDDFEKLSNDDEITKTMESPNEYVEVLDKNKLPLFFLYLYSLKDKGYDSLASTILDLICQEDSGENKNESEIYNLQKEISKYKERRKSDEKTINKLKTIAKDRKEKISEFEYKINLLMEENEKLKQKNLDLMVENSELKLELSKINEINNEPEEKICACEEKELCIVCISENAGNLVSRNGIIQMKANDFILLDEESRLKFEQIYVYKSGIHIAKLRKIRQLSQGKAIFVETKQEIIKRITEVGDGR